MKRIVILAAFLAALSASLPASAAEGTLLKMQGTDRPVEIDSESMELRNQERTVVFLGSVSARREDMTLQADRVEVKIAEKGENVERIRALGNVRVRKKDLLASGKEGVYSVADDTVVLTGDPKVWRGRDAVAGEKIRIFLADERVEVEKARAIMYPGEKTSDGKTGGERP